MTTKALTTLILLAAASAALADGLPPRQRLLTVDDSGALNSTNALATQADLARVSASNQLAQAALLAARDGYRQAGDLLGSVASNLAAQAVYGFYGVELSSFDAAVVFDESEARLKVAGFSRTDETSVVNGVPCGKWTVRFAFNQDLQSAQPYLAYAPVVNGAPREEWDNLAPDFVTAPVREEGAWTDGEGNTYEYLYRMEAWIPSEPSGFLFIRVPNDAALADGATLDLPNGTRGGQTVEVRWGGKTLRFAGGLLVGVSE